MLSWSLIEALSAGCLVVASRTPPVEEAIRHEDNGLLVDFFSTEEIAAAVDHAIQKKHELQPLRDKARRTAVERYDLKRVCLPAQLRLVAQLGAAKLKRQSADTRTAANVQHLAGDEARVAVDKEHHGARDVVRLS